MLLKSKLPLGWFNDARSLKACEAFRARPIKRADWVDSDALSRVIYFLPADLRVLAEENKLDLLEFNAYGTNTPEYLIHPDKFFKLLKRKVKGLIRRE